MVVKMNKLIALSDYKNDKKNDGKVALYDLNTSTVLMEGSAEEDWVEIEEQFESLRDKGNYELVILPRNKPQIQVFNWGAVK